MENLYIDFIKRKTRPTTVREGCFYWIEPGNPSSEREILFAPTTNPEDLVLLNDKSEIIAILTERLTELGDSLMSELNDRTSGLQDRLDLVETSVNNLGEMLSNLDIEALGQIINELKDILDSSDFNILDLKSRLDELEERMNNLPEDDGLREDIDGLDLRLVEMEDRISGLSMDIDKMAGISKENENALQDLKDKLVSIEEDIRNLPEDDGLREDIDGLELMIIQLEEKLNSQKNEMESFINNMNNKLEKSVLVWQVI